MFFPRLWQLQGHDNAIVCEKIILDAQHPKLSLLRIFAWKYKWLATNLKAFATKLITPQGLTVLSS
jgi:hypothetical protein